MACSVGQTGRPVHSAHRLNEAVRRTYADNLVWENPGSLMIQSCSVIEQPNQVAGGFSPPVCRSGRARRNPTELKVAGFHFVLPNLLAITNFRAIEPATRRYTIKPLTFTSMADPIRQN